MQNANRKTKLAPKLIDFVNASPTPYHAVHNCVRRLEACGFEQLREREKWSLSPNSKYYVTRNSSSLIAFRTGEHWTPSSGISIVGAHTDSPCLRVKPVSRQISGNYIQVGVETYGGGTWPTWVDRDLSMAGRVYTYNNGQYSPALVQIKKPLLRIPTLAIHLAREQGTKIEINKEQHLVPMLGLVESFVNKIDTDECEELLAESAEQGAIIPTSVSSRHGIPLVKELARELDLSPAAIRDFELVLYDVQSASLGGLNNEFVFASRLDNLFSTFCAVESLCDPITTATSTASLISLFDHEEIGSQSTQGADGTFLSEVMDRISKDSQGVSQIHEVIAKSFVISADMAHAVHPNYPSNHEQKHRPELNGGPTIKVNANQRYATNSPGILLLEEAANRSAETCGRKVPLQFFVVKNDSSCGSTIGPIVAGNTGLRVVDIGAPLLSMHSIRETAGSDDVDHLVNLFTSFHVNFSEIDDSIKTEWL